MVPVIEITKIALLVMVGRTLSLMTRIIRHDAIVRKGRSQVGRRLAKLPDTFEVRTSDLV